MGYSEQAAKINAILSNSVLSSDKISDDEKRKIIDAILWFGQVAKFRCRNNSAYENFSREIFAGIAKVKYVPFKENGVDDFEVLRAVDIYPPNVRDSVPTDVMLPCSICGKIHPEGDSTAHFG